MRVRVKSGFSAPHRAARAGLVGPPGPLTAQGQSLEGIERYTLKTTVAINVE